MVGWKWSKKMTTKQQRKYRTFQDRKRISLKNTEPSLTVQYEKEACDINNIIGNYKQSGQIQHLNKRQGGYGDVSAATSYQEALELVERAEEEFYQLPSELRYKLNNDPYKFLEYVNDPANFDEMVELGLAEKCSDSGEAPKTGKESEPKTSLPTDPDSE